MARPEQISWAQGPPEDYGRYRPICSPKIGERLHFTILGDAPVGVLTHWLWNRCLPCTGGENGCDGCRLGRCRRWKGYLACWSDRDAREVIAEITTQVALDHPNIFSSEATSLRGWLITTYRAGKKPNSPMRAEFSPPPAKARPLPKSFDLMEALCRIWDMTHRRRAAVTDPPQDAD